MKTIVVLLTKRIKRKSENRYNIFLVTAEQINKIIKKLEHNKVTGPEKLLPKLVILSANITDSHLSNTLCHDLNNNSFLEDAKIATVSLIYKKE